MKRGIMIGIVIVALLLVACQGKNAQQSAAPVPAANTPIQQTPPPAEPINLGKTCASQGGDMCLAGEKCSDKLIEASDSFTCCTKQCVPIEQKSMSGFDFGQQNSGLGGVGK